MVSVEEFVARVLPLLEMEREAEVAAAEDALASGSPESAAAKGRALLNLRLADAEGGLLGRTLLTLVNNKASGWWRWGQWGQCGCVGLTRQALLILEHEPGDLKSSWQQTGGSRQPTRHPGNGLPAICGRLPYGSLVRPASCAPPQGGGSAPLPPHKLSPHDIVRLRPSKGDASGPPLAEGVVYRVRDAAVTVAGKRKGRGGPWPRPLAASCRCPRCAAPCCRRSAALVW
jgi:hypothetical protein